MTARTWHKGPPPHVGWWNASIMRSKDAWRWWDGKRWSWPCYQDSFITDVMSKARKPVHAHEQLCVRWTTYWPKNARVPRGEA